MTKLFASDLDGTLLNIRHESDDYIRSRLAALRSAGHITATSTGRSLDMIRTDELPGMYHICMNGAAILDPDLNVLFDHPIGKEILEMMYQEFKDLPLEYCTLRGLKTTLSKEEFWQHHAGDTFFFDHADFFNQSQFEATLEDLLAEPIYKINVHHPKNGRYEELDAWIAEHEDLLVDRPCFPTLGEYTVPGVNKASGVRDLARVLNIPDSEIYVFGDGGNDLEMLEAFENSYCPSSGFEEAKQAANYEIGPFQDYSVVDTMMEIAGLDPEDPALVQTRAF